MAQISYKTAAIVALVLLVLVLAFWMGGQVVELRNIAKDCSSQGRFEQLRSLLLIYHREHGHFPPTKYQTKANGPVHSWRVLLLPYIDANTKKLYLKYNFSEPWDSPGNLSIVQSPLCTNFFSMNGNGVANYLAVGEGDNWPSEKPLKARLVTAGKDQFLLVEYPDSQIRWMEPEY